MNIIINTDSSVPIYHQISQHIKRMLIDGQLKPGDQIPSIRFLAKQLKVGIITVQRAYDDLQKEGILETSKGKGTYICLSNDTLPKDTEDVQKEKIKKEIQEVAKKAAESRVSKETLYELINKEYERVKNE